MTTTIDQYYLVKYGEGLYMQQRHTTEQSAKAHIRVLKNDRNEEYSTRDYTISLFTLTETIL